VVVATGRAGRAAPSGTGKPDHSQFYRARRVGANPRAADVRPAWRPSTLPRMPVLVTGAEHALGRAAVAALHRSGGEVRAYLDPLAAPDGTIDRLRAAGAKVARGTLDDEGFLETALEQVHSVVHTAADVLTGPDAVLDDVASVLSAAVSAGCRRFVLVSSLGVDDPAGNPWLDALAEAEELCVDSPLDTVVIRRALTYGPEDRLTEILIDGAAGVVPDATHAPLYLADLAGALVAADDRDRADGSLPHLVVPLGGPDLLSAGELIAVLGGQITGGYGGAAARTATPDLPAHAVDLLSRELVPPRGAPAAGTPVRVGARLTREAFGSGPQD
jgi:uncharacterized protein YbjT (DUF2867 family)